MRIRRFPLILSATVPVLIALVWFVANSRAATETPEYKVVRTDEKYEVRDYPALKVATTPMEGANMNGSFGRLFRFITGTNEGEQKIEMTAPVLIADANKSRTMSFIMPVKTTEAGVPKPADKDVSLDELEAARYAVLRFAGGRTAENEKKAAAKLDEWMTAQSLKPLGKPMFAYYDPPWTPTFMRRNEVMVRIGKGEGEAK